MTNGEVCRRYNLQNHQLNEWRITIERGRFVSKRKKSLSKGPKSAYFDHENTLKEYVLQRRSVKSIVTVRSLICKLAELCPTSIEKHYKSRQTWAYRFI
jgi:transposase-like protein